MPWAAAGLAAAIAVKVGLRVARRLREARRVREAVSRAGGAAGPILLGLDARGRAVELSDRQLSAHGLILGASGAGKSTTLLAILAAQIRRGQPVVAIDLKGSPAFAAVLREAAEAAGRPFRCWSPDGPETWNPLAHGNATELKDKLIATERFTEPHYQRAAERYGQTALRVLQELDTGPITLGRVVEMLEPVRLAAATRRLPRERAAQVGDYLASLTPDQLSAVRGLASRLAIVSESHTGRYLGDAREGGRGVDLRAALSGSEVVLFSLNSSTYGRLSAQLGTLAVQDLVSAAGERLSAGDAVPATVGIDEFSALGSDNVMALLARGREAGVSVLLATQELADLDRSARGLRDQVLGNTAVKIAHRQDVPRSAETVAQLAGTVRDWERSYTVRPGRWGGSDMRSGTLRQVDRFVVEPDRVRSLQTGEAVVIVKTPVSRAHVTRVLPATSRDERSVER
jgi:type IV secretory pathway TraG/TraD family ATPase VirD4